MKTAETKEKLKIIMSEINTLESSKQLMVSIYNENIAFKKIQRDLLATELGEKYYSDFRILRLCQTGK
jgi:hypothetical protein